MSHKIIGAYCCAVTGVTVSVCKSQACAKVHRKVSAVVDRCCSFKRDKVQESNWIPQGTSKTILRKNKGGNK